MVQKHRLQADAPPPTLDGQHLRDLAEDCSTAAAEAFADNYTALLTQRVDRIARSIGAGHREMAMDAALSLRTASSMAGALRMSHLCSQLEKALVAADLAAAAGVARDIDLHLPELREALASRRRLDR
jgi:HPt (histidine-containing phosphotransfer) domain-containing protein